MYRLVFSVSLHRTTQHACVRTEWYRQAAGASQWFRLNPLQVSGAVFDEADAKGANALARRLPSVLLVRYRLLVRVLTPTSAFFVALTGSDRPRASRWPFRLHPGVRGPLSPGGSVWDRPGRS